jgi:hypothetical protein
MRRLFALLSLAGGSLSLFISAAILRLWIFRGRDSALYADNVVFLVCVLILLPLILVWLVVLRRRSGRRWPALDRTAFAATVAAMILLLVLTGALVVADSFVRFEVTDGGKIPLREIVISGRGGTGRIPELTPGGRQSISVACRGILAAATGEVRIQYRIGDQTRTRIVYSAGRELTDDTVEIRIDESSARRSPGGLLFPPLGEP